MDSQTTYNEAMAKLAEAQKCQDEIAGRNHELQQVNDAIIEISMMFNIYNMPLFVLQTHYFLQIM